MDDPEITRLTAALKNARLYRVFAFGDISLDQALTDRAEAIAGLKRQLAQRESEIAGSWNANH